VHRLIKLQMDMGIKEMKIIKEMDMGIKIK
jgi:hypothetical protein